LRKWALKRYGYVKNVEADDVVSHFVREENHVGATMDKDMLRGVAGTWFDTYHSRRTLHELSAGEANNFNLIQTLIGDATDNIKSLPKKAGDPMIPVEGLPKGQRQPFKLTEPMAIKLLDEFGWNWDGVVKIYESKGFSEKEATLNRQLICLNQWSPDEGVILWKSKKHEVYTDLIPSSKHSQSMLNRIYKIVAVESKGEIISKNRVLEVVLEEFLNNRKEKLHED
jgi:hypothetical protein